MHCTAGRNGDSKVHVAKLQVCGMHVACVHTVCSLHKLWHRQGVRSYSRTSHTRRNSTTKIPIKRQSNIAHNGTCVMQAACQPSLTACSASSLTQRPRSRQTARPVQYVVAMRAVGM